MAEEEKKKILEFCNNTIAVAALTVAYGVYVAITKPQVFARAMSGVSAGVAAVTKFSTKVASKAKGISKVSNNASNNAKVVNKTVQIYQKNIQHIFRDAPGHLLDTPENRKLLVDVTSDSKSFLGKDKFGNDWHAKIIEGGKQVWTSSRNGEIRNGGVNDIPKIFNTQTGLSSPTKP